MSISERYAAIRGRVDDLAIQAGRNPEDIRIIAVSKTFPASTVQEALDAGIYYLGENRVQEAADKKTELRGTYEYHMIGHLQSNKVKEAVALFDCIHGIDKFSTARKLDAAAADVGKQQNILLQVNTSKEPQKSGIEPDRALDTAKEIMRLPNLHLRGLMTVGPLTDNEDEVIKAFRSARSLFEQMKNHLSDDICELSMGMSGDYHLAIAEGATMLRIGSAIFGRREYR